MFQEEWVNNAVKDGIIILIQISTKINGLKMKNGLYSYFIRFFLGNGPA
jgi:hypothetical protein